MIGEARNGARSAVPPPARRMERYAREHDPADELGVLRREAHRHPAAERAADEHTQVRP